MNASPRELTNAILGAFLGCVLPIALHLWAARVGDAEAFGMPFAVYALPGFFLGAILGAFLGKR